MVCAHIGLVMAEIPAKPLDPKSLHLIHPPHEAAHIWKDFYIDIATIVVDLLIALGLEQSAMSQ
jgi:hypothetical protein